MIRKLLEDHIKNNMPDSEVAVLLSGGVDSISVGLAASSIGKEVHAYSFHLDTQKSSDFLKAKEVSEILNWKFTEVIVSTKNIVEDFKYLANNVRCERKTHFECGFPFLYVYPKITQKYVLTGWGADGYFGVSRKAMKRYSSDKKWDFYVKWCTKNNNTIKGKDRKDGFDIYRREYLDGDCAGLKIHTKIATMHDKIHVTPYLNSDIRKHLMKKSWEELNKPVEKNEIRKSFEEFQLLGKVKPHQNLHLNAGIDDVFKPLLNNSDINLNERKRMMDVCRDWYLKNRSHDVSTL